MNKKFTLLYFIVLAFAFFVHGSLNGQVVNNNDVVVISNSFVSTQTLSNFQIASGTNRLLVIYISWVNGPGASINSATYNGTNLIQGTSFNLVNVFHQDIWYLPLGTGGSTSGDVVVTLSNSNSSNFVIGANTFQNVDQATPIGNTNTNSSVSGTSSTLNISSNNINNLIVDAIVANGNIVSAQTLIYQLFVGWGASYQSADNGANNMTWTFNQGLSVHVGAEINHDGVTFLPVELTYFKGESKDHKNQLTWQTASELNNEGFEIEKSTDGQEWETIGFQKGQGSTNTTNNYAFTDERPFRGQNYYRLKQLDFDGQFEYSKVIVIENNTSLHEYRFFPNPTSNYINVETTEPTPIQITNSIGQIVKTQQVNGLSNIPVMDLPTGTYFLKIGQDFHRVMIQ